MLYNGSANAGDYSMETNLNDMAQLMDKWSKELGTGKMTPEAQEKLGELLYLSSQVLRDYSAKSGAGMHTEHHNNIEKMKSEWDPFDSSGRM
jgi:hypothetical protein